MYAVVRTGGKQYRVTSGSVFEIEKIDGAVGDSISLDDVLLLEEDEKVNVGTPTVAGASVACQILAQAKGEKKIIFKKIRRQGKQLKKGHRQQITRVKVTEINGSL